MIIPVSYFCTEITDGDRHQCTENASRYARLRGIIAMQMLTHANEMTAFAQDSRPDNDLDLIKYIRQGGNVDLTNGRMMKVVASTAKHAPRCGGRLTMRRQTPV